VAVHFFGTSYDPAARPATLALAAQYGLQDCVFEHPGRLRYFDALQVTLEADANLLLGSTDLAFTPSKTLAVLAAGRPVLTLAPVGSALLTRLAALGQTGLAFPDGPPEPASVRAIVAWLQDLAAGRSAVPRASREWDAAHVAAVQLDILATARHA